MLEKGTQKVKGNTRTVEDENSARFPAGERGMSGACSSVMQTSHHLRCIKSKSLRFVINKNGDK